MEFFEKEKNQRLWHYFADIASIPRCSGNEQKIAQYLVKKAQKANMKVWQDEIGNVMIKRAADAGFEKRESIILQGHMDMICEKTKSSNHDFNSDSLELLIESDEKGRWLRANHTTLGADNGIALAIAMALIEDGRLKCAAIELLFTVDEECGLKGALELDPKGLKGTRLINIDSEEEGVFYTGCAGGASLFFKKIFTSDHLEKRLSKEHKSDFLFELEVSGFAGGHSGVDIHKPRENAIISLAQWLDEIAIHFPVKLIDFNAKGRHNVISNQAKAMIIIDEKSKLPKSDLLIQKINQIGDALLERLKIKEPNAQLSLQRVSLSCLNKRESFMLSPDDSRCFFSLIGKLPFGPIKWSKTVQGKVETSSNLASLVVERGEVELVVSQRSFIEGELDRLIVQTRQLFENQGWRIEEEGGYPGWVPDPTSELTKKCAKVWKELHGTIAKLSAIHAGLECGVLQEKLPGCQMISLGPDIENVHSPNERLNIESTQRIYDFLLKLLPTL